nr:hypothetical protein [Tanacetum cinerariifolium]
MLLDVVGTLVAAGKERPELLETLRTRARRYAAVQERLIGPDGSFAAFGRSLAYRCGAFQHLAQCSLQGLLPEDLGPGQHFTSYCAGRARSKAAEERRGITVCLLHRQWRRRSALGHQPRRLAVDGPQP